MKKLALFALIVMLAVAAAPAGTRIVVKRSYSVRPIVVKTHLVPPARRVVAVAPALGCVDINSNRDGAAVYVNDAYAGTAGRFDGYPGKLELKPGVYKISVVYGDRTHRHRVRVTAGGEVDLKIRF